MYIAYIKVSVVWPNNPSKGIHKRQIAEMMTISKEQGETSTKKQERSIIEFVDSEKVGGI